MKIKISYIVNSSKWNPKLLSFKRAANKALWVACQELGVPAGCEITINLSDDKEIQHLNKTFRGKDKPTNVLSFPQYELCEGNFNKLLETKRRFFLGDIAVSYQRVYTESSEQSKVLLEHFLHLVVHGFLHLCGFDHTEEKQAKVMESLEVRILKELGIADPY